MAIQSYTSPIDIKWNTDNQGSRITIPIYDEQHMIALGQITLNQIPDYGDKVQIDGLYEIEYGIPDSTQFKVNYDMGIVTFHESHETEVITINQYSGRGMWSISANKIYDMLNGLPVSGAETLQDFINKVREYQFGNWDSTKVYLPNSVVYYNGSTFVCLKQTLHNEVPTNTEYWNPFATGTYWKGLYDNTKAYDLRDIVYYDDEKATYICIKQTTVGILPTDTEYWEKIFSVKEVSDYAQAQGDYAKAEGDILNDTINQFNYIGEYDNTINYLPKNMIKYHGSTYINTVACQGILPTDANYWRILAAGYVFKGEYDSNKSYEERDIVYYGIEKTLYECINQTTVGISPYNIGYWKPMLNVKDLVQEINDYVNDTTSLYVAHDMGIAITHNLNDYPLPLSYTLGGAGYGNNGFGLGSYGGGIMYQVLCRADYIDANNIKLYFNEGFNGTPTITSISSTQYQIDFSNDISIIVKLK